MILSIKKYWFIFILFFGFAALFLFGGSSNGDNLPDKVNYNYDIRPILSENCYTCHGPDSSSRMAELRLDLREEAIARLASGNRAIVPNNPRNSVLLDRVASTDPKIQMPPPEMNKHLSDREIRLLKKWIKQGAKWEPYWAFIPPTESKLPSSTLHKSPSQIIDHLIDDKLKLNQLSRASTASKNKLIRRISYLLTGLPPKAEEIKKYVHDTSDQAYENMVDYYLASPQYGERWARHWMDLMRYGEYMGHEFDFPISGAWQYRDYLIRAFNEDVPYDLLVKEHLAGDMLDAPRLHPTEKFNESIIGTGYFFLGEGKHSPVSLKGEELDRIDNMIDVTSRSFQALTVSCARCHDHKFDPIPTTDYYAMYGMIESARLGPLPARLSEKDEAHLEELDRVKKKIRSELGSSFSMMIHKLSEDDLSNQKEYINTLLSEEQQDFQDDELISSEFDFVGDFRKGHWDGWYTNGLAFGTKPIKGEPKFDSLNFTVEKLESSYASSRAIGTGLQGTLHSPYMIIDKDSIAVRARGNGSLIRIIVDNFQLIQNPLWGSLEKIVDDSEWKTYILDVTKVKGHKAYIAFLPGHYSGHQYQIAPEHFIDIQYAVAYNNSYSDRDLHQDGFADISSVDQMNHAIANWENGDADHNQIQFLNYLLSKHEKLGRASIKKEMIVERDRLVRELYSPAHFIGAMEGDAVFSSVFIKGNKDNLSEEKISRRFLSAVQNSNHTFPQNGSGRLAWAESLVDQKNPLTSRVIVNRIWHHLFGRGIVETVDNFGLQGKLPSHPKLLDYLSNHFVEQGWSIKKLIKQILLSQTFRQSTMASEESIRIDPDNILLSHFPIRRLEAEAIRDAVLATSESLDLEMFGESIPIHLTEFMTGRGRPSASGPLDGEGRRSIYIAVRRNFLSPMMSVFDTPIPFSTFGKRNTTNVPAQSLTLMNDPFIHDQANKWANRLLEKDLGTTQEKLQSIYVQAFSRAASEEEIQNANHTLNDLAKNYERPLNELENDPQLWTDYCHIIFNLKEFIHLL